MILQLRPEQHCKNICLKPSSSRAIEPNNEMKARSTGRKLGQRSSDTQNPSPRPRTHGLGVGTSSLLPHLRKRPSFPKSLTTLAVSRNSSHELSMLFTVCTFPGPCGAFAASVVGDLPRARNAGNHEFWQHGARMRTLPRPWPSP